LIPDGAPRVLVVEDDTAITQLLASLLEEDGYRVAVAPSVEEAVRQLGDSTFALVLTDGFGARADTVIAATAPLLQAAGATPVLLCTAHPIAPEQAAAAGFRDLVLKPFDIDTLLAKVGASLHSARPVC
jgi:CheY-like chemotaxis protein